MTKIGLISEEKRFIKHEVILNANHPCTKENNHPHPKLRTTHLLQVRRSCHLAANAVITFNTVWSDAESDAPLCTLTSSANSLIHTGMF